MLMVPIPNDNSTINQPGWHGGLMHSFSRMMTICIAGLIPTRDCAVPSQGLCVVPSFLCVTRNTRILMGELTVWIVFSTVAIRMYRSSPLVPLGSCLTAAVWLQLHASLVHVSACLFAVSQASDLALLLVWYVA